MEKANQDFFVIAHNIRSLFNVGSIFRTADAFGVRRIYLTGYTGTPVNEIHRKKINKVALGAEKFVPWEHQPSAIRLIKDLKLKKVKIIVLENNVGNGLKPFPASIQKFKPKFPLALVLGEERRGVSKAMLALCNQAIEIPMLGKKESLNVSVAFGIAAFYVATNNK